MRILRGVGLGLGLFTIATFSGVALAQQDIAAAEALFNRGLADMTAGKYETGCPAIGESYRLDPRPGTLFTLAECESKAGRYATASARYDDYLSLFSRLTPDQQAKQKGRDKVATQKKAELAPLVPLLTLTLPADAPKGTSVKRDDVALSGPSLGIPLPVDPGTHVISSQVPGGVVNEMKITIAKSEKKNVVVEIKAAGEAPTVTPPPTAPPTGTVQAPPPPSASATTTSIANPPPAPDAGGGSGQKTGGYIALGIGGAGLLAGVITGILTLGKKSTISDNCNDAACNSAGKSAADSAKTTGLVSTIGFGVGIAGVGAGIILLVTAPSKPKMGAVPSKWIRAGVISVGPDGATVGVRGGF